MRISDWSSDVCSSDLRLGRLRRRRPAQRGGGEGRAAGGGAAGHLSVHPRAGRLPEAHPESAGQLELPDRAGGGQPRPGAPLAARPGERKSGGQGKGGPVAEDMGWRRLLKKKKK